MRAGGVGDEREPRLGMVAVHGSGSPPVNEVPGVSTTTQALQRVITSLLTFTGPHRWEDS